MVMKETIFGVTRTEILRQINTGTLKCDSNSPLRNFETLEPCIKGGKKILGDKKLSALLQKIYTGNGGDVQ